MRTAESLSSPLLPPSHDGCLSPGKDLVIPIGSTLVLSSRYVNGSAVVAQTMFVVRSLQRHRLNQEPVTACSLPVLVGAMSFLRLFEDGFALCGLGLCKDVAKSGQRECLGLTEETLSTLFVEDAL